MVIGLIVGAFPVKVTVPVIDEAANATPGHAAAANAITRDTPFAVLRILASFISGRLPHVVETGNRPKNSISSELYTGRSMQASSRGSLPSLSRSSRGAPGSHQSAPWRT
jgi:hypothetical protein